MPIANPPHKPPWFPEGDPLDPLNQDQLDVKLPQRFVNDTHQTYDVITWLYPRGLQDITGFIDTVGIFANPFGLLSLGFNNINSFIAYERFTPSDFPYDAYVEQVFNVIDAFRNINSMFDVTNRLQSFGSNVDDLFQGTISVSQPTTVKVSYLEKDFDGSNKISHKIFSGETEINFNWKPDGILPWSVDVFVLSGDDIEDDIKSILDSKMLFDNIDFPLPEVDEENEIELLKKKVTKTTQTIENEFSITETKQLSPDCCAVSHHIWGRALEQAQLDAMEAFANNMECNKTEGTVPPDPYNIVNETPAHVKSVFEQSSDLPVIFEANGDETSTGTFTGIITKGELSENNDFFWDIVSIENTKNESTFEVLQESYFDIDEKQFSFALLSRANNNYWNLLNINPSDFGDTDFNVYYRDTGQQLEEIEIELIYFAKDMTEKTADNECTNDSDFNVLVDNQQTETVRGDPNSEFADFRPLWIYLVYPNDLCSDNPTQQYRDVVYTKKRITETTNTIDCELVFEEPNDRTQLNVEDAINRIDSWWFEYIFPEGSNTPELKNG